MPELPDVQVFKQLLDKNALGKRVAKTQVRSPELLEGTTAATLERRLKRRRLTRSARHGKFLFARIGGEGSWLVLHFGMAGFLKFFTNRSQVPKHTQLLLQFTNGAQLAYDCRRKLGEIGLAKSIGGFVRNRELGIDPFDPKFKLAAFREILSDSRGTVKSMLMDQSRLAGIGNVYSDEILFRCGIHPKTKANELSSRNERRLFKAVKAVLRTAIRCKADPARFPNSYLLPHREKNGQCPRCGRKLRQIKVGGRTTFYCAKDQKRR